ncbi:hypothetical protein [Allonocardiopsis opalescens]|uniref:Terminase small subunit n=1 Tax=Allonocardiopsis opalescens TaxID=1144618 RepID=A0A2T0PPK3_9ACTN|nr:hypothetical protein [Allonocardiopsis opalescens]PRX90835.1 hypothetical protein CLV72_11631 [Allonocardiopsis opalescens]
MSRGGARVVSGPAPDPNALRRNRKDDKAGWVTLPAEGRAGDPPEWPLIDLQPREWDLWLDLWSRPQAVMWERLDQRYEVAMFVRKLAEAELPRASVELQKVVRQYLDSLGLSVQGMLRNRWKIAPAAAAIESDESAPAPIVPMRRSVRDRMRVVRDGEGG